MLLHVDRTCKPPNATWDEKDKRARCSLRRALLRSLRAMNALPRQPRDREPSSAISSATAPAMLVLGGSGVIGSAVCRHFARHGWNVIVHYHTNRAAADAVLRVIEEHGRRGEVFQADVGDPASVHAMFDLMQHAWPGLDACVWAVGRAVNRVTVRLTPSEWDGMMRANLTGLFLCLQRAGEIFSKQRGGAVTVVGSLTGELGRAGHAAYAACKAGAVGFVKSAAREFGNVNVRVNAVFPGWHPSPLAGAAFPGPDDLDDHVLGRTPSLDDVADVIYRLTTARDISGQIYNVDNRLW